MSTFAERLKTLRRAAGLSQTELAGDGISPSYVSLLESGRRTPSPAVAALLAAKLGCSASQLLDGEPSERERRVQLELAYAELALRHEGSRDAMARLSVLLKEKDLPAAITTQAALLLAQAQEQSGDLLGAVATLTPLFERARSGDRTVSVAKIGIHLCHFHKTAGDLNRAVHIGEEALRSSRDQGLDSTDDYFMLAATVMDAYGELGDESHAATWARQLIDAAEAAGSRGGQAALYWNASILAEREGRIEDALQLSRKALAHLGEMGETRDLARLKIASASVLLAADPPFVTEARDALDKAQADVRRLGGELDVVEWEYVRSTIALLDGDLEQAEALAESAIQRLPEEAGSLHLSLAHQALADALAAQGRSTEARDHYEIASGLRVASSPGRGSALLWRDLAERLLAIGEIESAVVAFRHSLDAAGVRNRSRAVLRAIAGTSIGSDENEAIHSGLGDVTGVPTAAVTTELR